MLCCNHSNCCSLFYVLCEPVYVRFTLVFSFYQSPLYVFLTVVTIDDVCLCQQRHEFVQRYREKRIDVTGYVTRILDQIPADGLVTTDWGIWVYHRRHQRMVIASPVWHHYQCPFVDRTTSHHRLTLPHQALPSPFSTSPRPVYLLPFSLASGRRVSLRHGLRDVSGSMPFVVEISRSGDEFISAHVWFLKLMLFYGIGEGYFNL